MKTYTGIMPMQMLLDRIQNYLLGDNNVASYYNDRILIGHHALDHDMGPPRIVIVPKGGSANVTPEYPGQNSNPSTLRTKDLTFTAHIWGSTRDDCEYMQAGIMTACFYAVGGPRAYISSDFWVPTGHDVAGYYLTSEFLVTGFTIPRIELPLTKPISADIAGEVTIIAPTELSTPVDAFDTTLTLPISP